MADFRKPKYSGSLNLAPECGPVLIELDTDAKTATASLEDPASQYTLAGGGGGLDYVIPEQTVTFQNGEATLQNINTSSLEDGDHIIAKIVEEGSPTYVGGSYATDYEEIDFAPSVYGHIENNVSWYMDGAVEGAPYTISAIKAPF